MLVSRENLTKTINKVFPFNLLNSEKIKSLVEKSEVVFFKEGDLVYLEGAAAINFYVIYEGVVEIFVEEHQSLRRLNSLHDGDFFGEDVLKQNASRSSTARVIKDALLIKIPKKLMVDLLNENHDTSKSFSIISRTYKRLLDLKFRDLSQESVYYLGNPHFFSFASRIFLSFMILLFPVIAVFILVSNNLLPNSVVLGGSVLGAVLLILQIFWHYFEWQNDYYLMTGKRIINLAKSLINFDSKFEIPLSAINNLEIKKSFLARNLDFGDLIIRTYTGETCLKNVPFVSQVQALLELLVEKDKISKKLDEKRDFEKIVNKSLTTGKDNLELSTNQADDAISLADQYSNPSTIVLRTHWIILLKKVLFPTLLIASIILLVVFFTVNNLPINGSSLAVILVGLILFAAFLWWLFQFFDWWNDQYLITSDQIIDVYRRPFGTENRRTAPIMNIQSIRFERKGILGLLLNFGTVYIRVGDEELTFDNVHDPANIQERLFGVLEMSISRLKRSETTEQQQNIAEWIETYHQLKEKKAEGSRNQ
jgi:membrane protein YdbS with pleckstrin-like domain